MAVRRGCRLDQRLLYRRWPPVALAGLVRIRDQRGSLRVESAAVCGGPSAGGFMKAEPRRLLWRYIGSALAIAVIVGMAVEVARWTGPLG
jgi:hypothetical protein